MIFSSSADCPPAADRSRPEAGPARRRQTAGGSPAAERWKLGAVSWAACFRGRRAASSSTGRSTAHKSRQRHNRHRLQLQNSQPTGQQPHTAQPAATNQRARARFQPNAQAHEPKRARTHESRRARVRVGTPGGSSTSAGAEAQNIFRCVSNFFISPGSGRKNKRGVKKKNGGHRRAARNFFKKILKVSNCEQVLCGNMAA